MEQTRIYEDGTAELILLRALLPWSSIVWSIAAAVYFSGTLPANGALGHTEYGVLRTLTYVGGSCIALAALVVATNRPLRVKLPALWVALTLSAAALSFMGVMMLLWFTAK